jgi:hypothetical protein
MDAPRTLHSLVVDCDQYFVSLTDAEVERINDLLDDKDVDPFVELTSLEELPMPGHELIELLQNTLQPDSIESVDELNRLLKGKLKS